jgi:putative ABC transport system permease protein
VFVHVILEGMIITSLGTVVGLLLGHGALELLRRMLPRAEGGGVSITGFIFMKEEYLIFFVSILVGALAALIPAWNAYKTDISKVLAKG